MNIGYIKTAASDGVVSVTVDSYERTSPDVPGHFMRVTVVSTDNLSPLIRLYIKLLLNNGHVSTHSRILERPDINGKPIIEHFAYFDCRPVRILRLEAKRFRPVEGGTLIFDEVIDGLEHAH